MKKNLIFLLIFPMFIGIASCEKTDNACKLIPAKVLRYDCDRVILQLLTNEQIGDPSWKNVQNGETYTNVVSYNNTCLFTTLKVNTPDTLYVEIKTNFDQTMKIDCAQCLVASNNPPKVQVDFLRIERSPCSKIE